MLSSNSHCQDCIGGLEVGSKNDEGLKYEFSSEKECHWYRALSGKRCMSPHTGAAGEMLSHTSGSWQGLVSTLLVELP